MYIIGYSRVQGHLEGIKGFKNWFKGTINFGIVLKSTTRLSTQRTVNDTFGTAYCQTILGL